MSQLQRYDYHVSPEDAGVLHIGVGSFHRSHQAVYLDDLLARHDDKSWAIIGVNLRKRESALVDNLNRRSGKYILKIITDDGIDRYREIRSITHIVDWVRDSEAAHALLALPQMKIVTVTVTECGYYTDKDGKLDSRHDLIKRECAENRNLGSIYGFLREGLLRRMSAGGGNLTILCCDNLRGNGKLLRECFYSYLRMTENGDRLIAWLDRHATFPCSMVDRITPPPSPNLRDEIADKFNIIETAAVNGEEFIQWVIEDKFATDASPLKEVGVMLVDDVTPYEDTKIRILNGGHTCLAYFGALQGYIYFDEVMKDAELLRLYDDFQKLEVVPALMHDLQQDGTGALDIDFDDYVATTKRRFANPIGDTVERIASDGCIKFANFILPTVRSRLRTDNRAEISATIIASWYIFLCRAMRGKIAFPYHDEKWRSIGSSLLHNGLPDRQKFLHSAELWQEIPQAFPNFVKSVDEKISLLEARYYD